MLYNYGITHTETKRENVTARITKTITELRITEEERRTHKVTKLDLKSRVYTHFETLEELNQIILIINYVCSMYDIKMSNMRSPLI
jgi:hypothetical protein